MRKDADLLTLLQESAIAASIGYARGWLLLVPCTGRPLQQASKGIFTAAADSHCINPSRDFYFCFTTLMTADVIALSGNEYLWLLRRLLNHQTIVLGLPLAV